MNRVVLPKACVLAMALGRVFSLTCDEEQRLRAIIEHQKQKNRMLREAISEEYCSVPEDFKKQNKFYMTVKEYANEMNKTTSDGRTKKDKFLAISNGGYCTSYIPWRLYFSSSLSLSFCFSLSLSLSAFVHDPSRPRPADNEGQV